MKQWTIFLMCFLAMAVHGQDTLRLSSPLIDIESPLFSERTRVLVHFGMKDAERWIRMGEKPAVRYNGPVFITENTLIEAYVTRAGFHRSESTFAQGLKVGKTKPEWIFATSASSKYTDSGGELNNLQRGMGHFTDQQYVGYDSDSVVYRFRVQDNLSQIGLSFFTDPGSWILSPNSIVLSGWDGDQKVYENTEYQMAASDLSITQQKHHFWEGLSTIQNKFPSMIWQLVIHPAVLPDGHPGAGKNGWVFIDELILNP